MKLLFAATALVMLAAACSGGGSKRTPTVLGTATLGPPATAGMILERTPPPTPVPVPFDGPANHDYRSGDTITDRNGILLVDPVRLTAQVWTMPDHYAAGPVSHDGRWVFWSRLNSDGSIVGSQQLLDTRNGTSRAMALGNEPVQAVGVSESGKYFAGVTATKVGLFETETLRPLTVTDRLALLMPDGEAGFSADEGMDAIAFRKDDARATVVLGVSGGTATLRGGGWPFRWSNLGHKLALTVLSGTGVYDLDADTNWYIPVAGFNPQWSPDDRYLAIANKYDVGGAHVFSTSPPYEEVLRTVGSAICLGDYWYADGSIRYTYEQEVTIPGGKVQSALPFTPPAVLLDQTAPEDLQVLKDGKLIMQFKLPDAAGGWAYFYDDAGVLFQTTDGRVLALLGYGGKGLCDAQLPPPTVQLPPFGP